MKKKLFCIVFSFLAIAANGQARFDRIDSISVTVNSNSIRFPWAGGINFPNISEIDLNNDGRKDLFMFDRHNNRILTFVNNGSTNYTTAWDYAPVYATQFPPVNKWALLYDYNCDGKVDFFTLSSIPSSGIAVYRNDFTPANGLQWTLVDTFLQERFAMFTQNVFASGVSIPAFVDLDNDSDMDILGYNTLPDGRIAWHKNFSMENYGVCDSLDFQYVSGCWGDFTLLIGGANQVGCFNCPCRMSRPDAIPQEDVYLEPASDQSDAARRDDTISGIFAIDLDGDGDKELLVGDIASRNSLMIRNGGTPDVAQMNSQDIAFPSYDTPADFNGFHYHASIDVDNDGVKDLIVSPNDNTNQKGMWLYKNIGTNVIPIYHFETNTFLQNQMIDVGENACPALVDYDGDGLLDLMIGGTTYIDSLNGYKSSLYVYKNTGTVTQPAFRFITNNFANISSLNYGLVSPSFGDIDGDGDMDMILGNDDGRLNYFTNLAGAGNLMNLSLSSPFYFGIDIGNFSAPQFFDLNQDGLLDLLVGEKNGFINYFQNTGSTTVPTFIAVPTNDTLGCIFIQLPGNIDGYTVPFAYDSLTKTRMVVATEMGSVLQYEQISGNMNGCFNNAGMVFPIESSRIKFNLSVSGGDLNGDGLVDLVVGQGAGGVHIYYQHDPTASVSVLPSIRPSVLIYPNPASDHFSMEFFNLNAAGTVLRIFDSMGKLMLVKNIEQTKVEQEVSDWPAGFYLIQLISAGSSSVQRITISR